MFEKEILGVAKVYRRSVSLPPRVREALDIKDGENVVFKLYTDCGKQFIEIKKSVEKNLSGLIQ